MPDPTLAELSVQDIELELIRRRRFNAFDGARIADSLERHSQLWLAAHMDRFGLGRTAHPDWFPQGSLIKLRDLRSNRWNVDTLVVLTADIGGAGELANIARVENWCADELAVQEDTEEEIAAALGRSSLGFGVFSAWWD